MSSDTIDSEVDQILCDLHDLGFHGKDLAHLETLAEYIQKSKAQEANKARIDELKKLSVCEYDGEQPAQIYSLHDGYDWKLEDRIAELGGKDAAKS